MLWDKDKDRMPYVLWLLREAQSTGNLAETLVDEETVKILLALEKNNSGLKKTLHHNP